MISFQKPLHIITLTAFVACGTLFRGDVFAQAVLDLPKPGAMVNLSKRFDPPLIKGLKIDQNNPFLFDFIVDIGQDKLSGQALKLEGERMIRYFMASLAMKDEDLWVNLSPFEKDRIIPETLGGTDMGRDMLAQDYLLKQLTASLIYPEKELGKKFWSAVYTKTNARFGAQQIPMNMFNKVWIVADKTEVYEKGQTVLVTKSHLKVMLEEDYLASQANQRSNTKAPQGNNRSQTQTTQIIRDIILPEIEHEVNQGQNFAHLRQIFNAIILATWYKKNLEQSLITQIYADKGMVKGIEINDLKIGRKIYERYLQAYKKGVFNYIKDDLNTGSKQLVPRKYFSGGVIGKLTIDKSQLNDAQVTSLFDKTQLVDFAMRADVSKRDITGQAKRSQDKAMTQPSQAKIVFLRESDREQFVQELRRLLSQAEQKNNTKKISHGLTEVYFFSENGSSKSLLSAYTSLKDQENLLLLLHIEHPNNALFHVQVNKAWALTATVSEMLNEMLSLLTKPLGRTGDTDSSDFRIFMKNIGSGEGATTKSVPDAKKSFSFESNNAWSEAIELFKVFNSIVWQLKEDGHPPKITTNKMQSTTTLDFGGDLPIFVVPKEVKSGVKIEQLNILPPDGGAIGAITVRFEKPFIYSDQFSKVIIFEEVRLQLMRYLLQEFGDDNVKAEQILASIRTDELEEFEYLAKKYIDADVLKPFLARINSDPIEPQNIAPVSGQINFDLDEVDVLDRGFLMEIDKLRAHLSQSKGIVKLSEEEGDIDLGSYPKLTAVQKLILENIAEAFNMRLVARSVDNNPQRRRNDDILVGKEMHLYLMFGHVKRGSDYLFAIRKGIVKALLEVVQKAKDRRNHSKAFPANQRMVNFLQDFITRNQEADYRRSLVLSSIAVGGEMSHPLMIGKDHLGNAIIVKTAEDQVSLTIQKIGQMPEFVVFNLDRLTMQELDQDWMFFLNKALDDLRARIDSAMTVGSDVPAEKRFVVLGILKKMEKVHIDSVIITPARYENIINFGNDLTATIVVGFGSVNKDYVRTLSLNYINASGLSDSWEVYLKEPLVYSGKATLDKILELFKDSVRFGVSQGEQVTNARGIISGPSSIWGNLSERILRRSLSGLQPVVQQPKVIIGGKEEDRFTQGTELMRTINLFLWLLEDLHSISITRFRDFYSVRFMQGLPTMRIYTDPRDNRVRSVVLDNIGRVLSVDLDSPDRIIQKLFFDGKNLSTLDSLLSAIKYDLLVHLWSIKTKKESLDPLLEALSLADLQGIAHQHEESPEIDAYLASRKALTLKNTAYHVIKIDTVALESIGSHEAFEGLNIAERLSPKNNGVHNFTLNGGTRRSLTTPAIYLGYFHHLSNTQVKIIKDISKKFRLSIVPHDQQDRYLTEFADDGYYYLVPNQFMSADAVYSLKDNIYFSLLEAIYGRSLSERSGVPRDHRDLTDILAFLKKYVMQPQRSITHDQIHVHSTIYLQLNHHVWGMASARKDYRKGVYVVNIVLFAGVKVVNVDISLEDAFIGDWGGILLHVIDNINKGLDPPDSAMKAPGGINLNTQRMGLSVAKEGAGVNMNLNPDRIDRIQYRGVDGLIPVFLRITPIKNIASFLN